MRAGKWMVAGTLGILMVAGSCALAYGQGKGKGKGHNKHGDDDQSEQYYRDRDRERALGWYNEHEGNLPPGLAKKDRLPPGLEKQLARNGTLPPGLQKRIQPCPPELVRVLPPGCEHVSGGGPYTPAEPENEYRPGYRTLRLETETARKRGPTGVLSEPSPETSLSGKAHLRTADAQNSQITSLQSGGFLGNGFP